jgi:hypothetical protein
VTDAEREEEAAKLAAVKREEAKRRIFRNYLKQLELTEEEWKRIAERKSITSSYLSSLRRGFDCQSTPAVHLPLPSSYIY